MQLNSVVSQRIFKTKKMSIYYRKNKKHIIKYNTKGIFECCKCKAENWSTGDIICWLINNNIKKIKDGELLIKTYKRVILKKGINAIHEKCNAEIKFKGYFVWVENIENEKIRKIGVFSLREGTEIVFSKYCETKKEQLILFKKLCKEYE